MAGIKTLFSKSGAPLTDLRASVVRSSMLNSFGDAVFNVVTMSSKCKREFLDYGNYIVVQHGSLPPWVGVIDTPRVWHSSYVEIHAYEPLFLLQYRFAPQGTTLTGTPGMKMLTLLNHANTQGETLIRAGNIYSGGVSFDEVVSDDIASQMLKIAKEHDMYILFKPVIGSNGSLTIVMDFVASVGVVTPVELKQGKNLQFGDIPFEESGELVNMIEGMTDGTDAVSTYLYTEPASYGVRAKRIVYNGVIDSGLPDIVSKDVRNNKEPVFSTPLTVLDVGNTFANVGLGNIMAYKYSSVGFEGNGLGVSKQIRIEGYRFDELAGTCELMTRKVG